MSTGTRIPLEKAHAVARALCERWALAPSDVHIVGSVRRRRPDVGDLELVMPAQDAGCDALCGRLQATMAGDGLFAGAASLAGDVIGRAVSGLKPGFLAASLVVRPYPPDELPVQLYRYTPENFGWMMIERTGPMEFGRWFLAQWKRHWNIPAGGKASIDNHLRDAGGNLIRIESERAAFNLCGMQAVEPEDRDEFMARMQARSGAVRGGR